MFYINNGNDRYIAFFFNKLKTMNLRRITKTLLVCLIALGFTQVAQAQAQLAGVSQDGLIQLGSNHPFVVSTYEMDITPYGLSTQTDAVAFFRKYIEEGFNISFDLADGKAYLNLDLHVLSQFTGQSIEVSAMNEKLRAVHRIRR